MLLPDLFLAFLAGGLIGPRSAGWGRRLVVRFALLGLGLPAVVLFWLWPDWYLHYALPVVGGRWVVAAVLLLCFVWLAVLGQWVARHTTVFLPLLGLPVSIAMWFLRHRTLHVGSQAQWQADTAPWLPLDFLLAFAGVGVVTVVVFLRTWAACAPSPEDAPSTR